MMAEVTGYEVGDFIHTLGDAHLYANHFDQAREQLSRSPRNLPQFKFRRPINELSDFEYDDFVLTDYDPHPHIKAPVAV